MEQRTKKYEIEREQLRQKLDKSLNFLASLKDEQSSLSQEKLMQQEELMRVRQELVAAKQAEQQLQEQLKKEKQTYEQKLREISAERDLKE